MKLNRAYTQSLNDSIERIKLLFSDEEKFSRFNFTSKQFTGAIKAKMVLLEDILVEIILAKQLLIKLALLKNKLNLILH